MERYDIIMEDSESGYGGNTCQNITEACTRSAKVVAISALLDKRFRKTTTTTTLQSISPWLDMEMQLVVAYEWPRICKLL
jgi:aspartate-semialdehyde dehydrogenase